MTSAPAPDISPDCLTTVQGILRVHLAPEVYVWVFGSRATWTAKEYSDLDLALEQPSGAKIATQTLHDLNTAFEESKLPWKVDVLDMNAIAPEFRAVVEADKMRLRRWTPYNLRDMCTKIGSGATPLGGKQSYLLEGEYSLIHSQNIYNNHFSYNGMARISEKQAHQLQNVEIQENDVLLNITGDSVARASQVPKDVLPARVNQLGDQQLKLMAHKLLESVRSNATIDWHHSEMARAKMRVAVKRILRKHGYPPDLQAAATQTVLQQAEAFSEKWAA